MSELQVLAATANDEHRLSRAAAAESLRHAIAAGHALLEAHALVPDGEWVAWLTENVSASKTSAYKYMRVARYEAALPGGELTLAEALKLLVGVRRINGQLGPAESEQHREEALRLLGEGFTRAEVREMTGVHKSTLHRWARETTPEHRAYEAPSARSYREARSVRAAESRPALEVVEAPGSLEEAAEQIHQVVQTLRAIAQNHQRIESRRALVHAIARLRDADTYVQSVIEADRPAVAA